MRLDEFIQTLNIPAERHTERALACILYTRYKNDWTASIKKGLGRRELPKEWEQMAHNYAQRKLKEVYRK